MKVSISNCLPSKRFLLTPMRVSVVADSVYSISRWFNTKLIQHQIDLLHRAIWLFSKHVTTDKTRNKLNTMCSFFFYRVVAFGAFRASVDAFFVCFSACGNANKSKINDEEKRNRKIDLAWNGFAVQILTVDRMISKKRPILSLYKFHIGCCEIQCICYTDQCSLYCNVDANGVAHHTAK